MKAIIFDMDGVLVDSEDLHHEVLQDILSPHNVTLPLHDYVGRADADAIRRAFELAGSEPSEDVVMELLEAKTTQAADVFSTTDVTPYEHTIRLFHEAREAMPVAVCTAGRSREVRAILTRLGLIEHLNALVTSDDVSAPKPAPECYLLACRQLGVAPADAVAIEDSVPGIAAASGAGLCVIGVGHTSPVDALHRANHVRPSTKGLTLTVVRALHHEITGSDR